MATLLIHLTDLHLDASFPDAEARAVAVADAALSPLLDISDIHIVVSGDLVATGSCEEFSIAERFLEKLSARIIEYRRITPKIILAAGNHDCDFSSDQSVRDLLLDSVHSRPDSLTEAISEQIASVLRNFLQFQAKLSPGSSTCNPWHYVLRVGGIRYVVLHSSVFSRLKEQAGKLYVQVPDLEYDPECRTVIVMHHPYAWLRPENNWALTQWAQASGDMFLMGHEHILSAQQVTNIHENSSLVYLRGHVFHDRKDVSNSAFQTVVFDEATGYQLRAYKLHDGQYQIWDKNSRQEMILWPGRIGKGTVSLSADGYDYLNNAGANFSHRRKERITLQDIYVWPEVRICSPEKDSSQLLNDGLIISAEQLAEREEEVGSIVVVKGGERHGKSALAKTLALQLQRRGRHPVLLSAENIASWREAALDDKLDGAIDQLYGRKFRSAYRQLTPGNCSLIIDDFDLPQLKKGFVEGVRLLSARFGTIYLMVDAYPGMEVPLNDFLLDEHFANTEVYELTQSNFHHRLELIERWLSIGAEPMLLDDSRKVTAAKLAKVVDETIGRNLIPSLPIFVLIILQRAEFSQDLDTVVQSGSHGFLYESMILQALNRMTPDVVTCLTYLTAFAAMLDAQHVTQVSQTEFEKFHVAHCERFHLDLSLRTMQQDLVSADLLDETGGCVRFHYAFNHYYFLARHISSIADWSALEPRIDAMIATIHTERSANVLLFMAHLKRDSRIAHKILSHAKGLFDQHPEVDLFAAAEDLTDFRANDIRELLIEGARATQLEIHQEDEREAECAQRDLDRLAEEKLQQRLDDALAMNGAFKTLQVLGQVLRNHAGELERQEKHEITDTCVSLGLRILSFLHEFAVQHKDEMLLFRAMQLKDEDPELTDDEIAKALETYLPSFISTVTVGTVIKIANAVGSESLAPTLNDVLSATTTRELLSLATKLEHFSDFPKEEVLSFKENRLWKNQLLPTSMLRRFIIRRLYLFPLQDELRRSVLDRFNIRALPFQALATQRRISSKSKI